MKMVLISEYQREEYSQETLNNDILGIEIQIEQSSKIYGAHWRATETPQSLPGCLNVLEMRSVVVGQ